MNKWKLLFHVAVSGLILLPSLAHAIPTIQHWRTANGAKVYFVAAPELPMVDAQVVFDAGSARDETKPGLAQLVNVLLDSGTEILSADAVAERLDAVGAQLSGGVERDMAWLSLRSLSEAQYLDPAVETVASLLKEPAFASDPMERERNRLITAVRAGEQSPATVAERTFIRHYTGNTPTPRHRKARKLACRPSRKQRCAPFTPAITWQPMPWSPSWEI
ncbi:MAG: insulinase family protein [Candidatus Competibacteraceae bacterium]